MTPTHGYGYIERGFSVIRLVMDEQAIRTLPVGVVAWDAERGWYQVRVLQEDERVTGVPAHLRLLLNTAIHNLDRWAKLGSIGGHGEGMKPTNSSFWDAARDRMASAVRLDSPKALEPTPHPDMGIDALFDAIVQPSRRLSSEHKRIDGAIKAALGPFANKLQGRFELRAFQGARESVLRAAKSDAGVVVVEGVNLAGSTARRDADALVSKLLRIKEGPDGDTTFVIGYLASPGGLNGETHMRYWMQEKISPDVYDLNSEQEKFRARTGVLLHHLDRSLRIL